VRLRMATLVAMIVALAAPAVGTSHWSPGRHNTLHAITWGFCGHQYKECANGREAKRIAHCETGGTYNVWAGVGKHIYWGLFQQGPWARGFGAWRFNPWAQADSAARLFKWNGFCWTCNTQWPTCGRGLD
jgi:hypothetical protein